MEPVAEKVDGVRELIDTVASAAAREIGRYSPEQLEVINDFLERMAETTRTERERLRDAGPATDGGDYTAPLGALREARLLFRSGTPDLTLNDDAGTAALYRARFEGAVPQVPVRDGVVSVQYRGGLFDFRTRRAYLALSSAVDWAIDVRGGAAHVRGDLTNIRLRSLEVSGGASKLDLTLGAPAGVVPIRVSGGASDVRLMRPAGAAVRLLVQGARAVSSSTIRRSEAPAASGSSRPRRPAPPTRSSSRSRVVSATCR